MNEPEGMPNYSTICAIGSGAAGIVRGTIEGIVNGAAGTMLAPLSFTLMKNDLYESLGQISEEMGKEEPNMYRCIYRSMRMSTDFVLRTGIPVAVASAIFNYYILNGDTIGDGTLSNGEFWSLGICCSNALSAAGGIIHLISDKKRK